MYNPTSAFIIVFSGYITIRDWTEIDISGQNDFVSIFDILFFILIFVNIIRIVYNKEKIVFPKTNGVNLTIILFFISISIFPAVGIIFNQYSISYITPTIRYFQWFLFFPTVIYLCVYKNLSYKYILGSLGLAVVVQLGYGSLQYLEYLDIITELPHHDILADQTDRTRFDGRSTGFFGNPNLYGILMAVCSLCFIPQIGKNNGSWPLIALILGIFGVLLSGSRTALVILIIPASFYILNLFLQSEGFNSKQILYLTSGIFISIGVLVPFVGDRFVELLLLFTGDFNEISTLEVRFMNWENQINSYRQNGPTMVFTDITTDSYYLSIIRQSGIFGLISVLVMYVYILREGIRSVSVSRIYSEVLILVVLAILLANITMTAMASIDIQVIFWSHVGFLFYETKMSSMMNPWDNKNRFKNETS
ncbi:O-antigen ligase family protein [Halonotius sp. GCM10025705]|uniref:O-antigen ligase family protein n=1 Tax=Halonotius sp. GCM10025705 TaxID=3252678 RepID=UPI00360D71A9